MIKDVQGQRVAIVGLSGAPDKNGFKGADGVATVRRVLQELQGQADGVVLLSHAAPDVNDRIADEVPGIAAIVEGGTAPLNGPRVSKVTGTPIYHADTPASGHAGRIMGIAKLVVDGGKLMEQSWRSVPLNPEFADDPAMAAWVLEVYQ